MTTQAEIDALTAKVGEVEEKLATAKQEIQTEIDSLEQQIKGGTPAADLDLTKLQGKIDNLGTVVTEVGGLRPTEPGTGATGQAPTTATGAPVDETDDPVAAAETARERI